MGQIADSVAFIVFLNTPIARSCPCACSLSVRRSCCAQGRDKGKFCIWVWSLFVKPRITKP